MKNIKNWISIITESFGLTFAVSLFLYIIFSTLSIQRIDKVFWFSVLGCWIIIVIIKFFKQ